MFIPENKKRLYIIAGQSNAVGGASIANLSLANKGYTRPFYGITVIQKLSDGGDPDPIVWQDYFSSFLWPRDGDRLGCELSLGRGLVAKYGAGNVVLGKMAINGTQLDSNWHPDAAYPKAANVFTQFVSFIKSLEHTYNSYLVGIVWDQGSGDANTLAIASKYAANLETFYSRLKKDIGHDFLFTLNRLSDEDVADYASVVREQEDAFADADPEWRKVVSTANLPLRDAAHHYSADSYIILGQRFVDALASAAFEFRLANYLVDKLLNLAFRSEYYTPPEAVYLSLYSSDPTNFDVGDEATASGYTRMPVNFNAANNRRSSSVGAVRLGPYDSDVEITHLGLRDSVSGGNLLFYGKLKNPITLRAGKTFVIGNGDLECSFTGAFSDYLSNSLLDHTLRGVVFTPTDVPRYLTLYYTDPTPKDVGLEVSGRGMSRLSMEFDPPISGTCSNSTSGTIGPITGPITGVSYFGVSDASSGGHMYVYSKFGSGKTLVSGSTITLNVGGVSFYLK